MHATAIVTPFSVHSTTIAANVLISQAGSYYVLTDHYLIWDSSQLYPVTQMTSILLHSNLAPPRSCVIGTILPL